MSRDIQPRRRKDKKGKKEEEDIGTPPPILVSPSPDLSAENLTIHIHKDGGTGGHWCARIIFFALLAILVGLISIILIEHRGAADVDTPIAQSRWVTVFDGWVDEVQSPPDHAESVLQHNEHIDQNEDEEESKENSHEVEQEDEETTEDREAEDFPDDDSKADDSGETEGHNDESDRSEEEEVSVKQRNVDYSVENDEEESRELDEGNYSEGSMGLSEPDDDDDDLNDNKINDVSAALEEIDKNTSAEEYVLEQQEQDEIINESDDKFDVRIEGVVQNDEDDAEVDDLSMEYFQIPGVNDIDDNSAEPLEEVNINQFMYTGAAIIADVIRCATESAIRRSQWNTTLTLMAIICNTSHQMEDMEPEEILNEADIEPEIEEVEEESSSVAVKFGVGVALVVAAHFVLVRRWNNAENNILPDGSDPQAALDLSRRNTLIPPPSADRTILKMSTEEAEICEAIRPENYENLRSKYKKLEMEQGEDLLANEKTEKSEEEDEDEDEEDEDEEEEEEEDEEEELSETGEADSDEEEDQEDEDEEDLIDDSELVAKLEAKYGKLPTPPESDENDNDDDDDDEDIQELKRVKLPQAPQSKSDDEPNFVRQPASQTKPAPKQGGARDFEYDDLINSDDAIIREELDVAQGQTAEKRVTYYTNMLLRHPTSPMARYALARAMDQLAEERKDNFYLRKAIAAYQSVLKLETLVPPKLFRKAGERCIDRFRFSGQYSGAEAIHKLLISRFSDETHLRNQLTVTYLMQNKLAEAKRVLQETLGRWPNDGFALAHYGFILKTGDGNMADAIMYLKAGIASGHEGTLDGRFFFHLGDALVRLGRTEEAKKVYESGAKNSLFPSIYQRSLYNVHHLTAHPWWTLEQTTYKEFFQTLEKNWQIIKSEGFAVLGKTGHFQNETENLKDKGNWQQFELFARGRKITDNCAKVPRTCSLMEGFVAATSCRRGQIKFSVMHPGTHIWPHCGPTNCRLRAHLGLSGTEGAYIRVGEETRTWREGSVMVFDDSFEHEVWHNGTLTRLVLIVDTWHPELRDNEIHNLPAI